MDLLGKVQERAVGMSSLLNLTYREVLKLGVMWAVEGRSEVEHDSKPEKLLQK